MARTAREDLIAQASQAVRKQFKDGISERGNKALELPSVFLSTGSLSLDRIASGRNPGGIPIGPSQGRVVHIAGEWSTGKSLILDHLFLSCQGMGGLNLVSETEGTRDPHFAQAIGLNLKLLEVQRPDTLEELFDMALAWHASIRKTDETIPICWGIDSLDSTEAEKSASKGLSESGGWHFGGGRSEALAAGLRKVVKITSRYPTTLVMLNQTRDNVGVFFGPKKRTPGGNPPHFYSSLELMLSNSPLGVVRSESRMPALGQQQLQRLGLQGADKGFVTGRWVRAKVNKTKIAPTLQQEADFYIDFRKGIHQWGGLLQSMLREGKVELTPDSKGVRHKLKFANDEETIEEFPTTAAWMTWLNKNPLTLGEPAYAGE